MAANAFLWSVRRLFYSSNLMGHGDDRTKLGAQLLLPIVRQLHARC